MLPSSVRRVVNAAPQSPLLSTFSSPAAITTRAPAVLAFSCNPRTSHQRRRYSSSKPSSPNDSSKGIADGQVTATPAQSTKQSGEKRRRKVKEGLNTQSRLPSVPSTQHVPQEALALSTFFSLHRPMSVTQSFPKTISDHAFAQIFAARAKSSKHNDVMSTLSKTVEQLEQPMQSLTLGGNTGVSQDLVTDSTTIVMDQQTNDDYDGMHRINLKHPDGTESSVYVQLNTMSGQFLPFRPPPAPQAGVSIAAAATNATETTGTEGVVADAEAPQHRVYKAMFTLEETIDENGAVRIVAHTPELVEEEDSSTGVVPRSFLERMALRQIRREHVRGQSPGMLAISVVRRRQLKMKKKKYKKLMKRTRNERRKLDRV